MRYISRIIAGLFLAQAFFVSCKKDREVFLAPQIIEQGLSAKDTIMPGDTVLMAPVLENTANVVFTWFVNGTEAASDPVFAFVPEHKGDFTITLRATGPGGITETEYHIRVWGKYENGFFILNEGWFGHAPGTISFYRYGSSATEDSVFSKENPGKTLGTASTTTQYATIFNEKLYIVSKARGPVVVADAWSLKETGRIEGGTNSNWLAFVGIDESRGLLSSPTGIYPVDLNTLNVGAKIEGVNGTVGSLHKTGNYVFAISQADGIVVLNASDYAVAKKISGGIIGFADGKDGSVWAASANALVKINPQTLETTSVTIPFNIPSPWGAWRAPQLTTSSAENTVYIARSQAFAGGTMLYKYTDGDEASLSQPFITLPQDQYFYGAGVRYNQQTGDLIITTINGPYSGDTNRILFYDSSNGTLKNTVTYIGWHFPAMPVFH